MEESKRERSRDYPTKTITECLDLIKAIIKLGKRASYSAVAEKINLSESTKSFRERLSSARQFGMIELNKGSISLTNLSNSILLSENDKKLLIQSFRTPKLYEELIDQFQDRALPTQEKLSIILMNLGVTAKASSKAATVFVESANILGLIRNGILDLNLSESEESEEVLLPETNTTNDEVSSSSIKKHTSSSLNQISEFHKFEIPTTKPGMTALIQIPSGLSNTDLDFLVTAFKALFEPFVNNLKTIDDMQSDDNNRE